MNADRALSGQIRASDLGRRQIRLLDVGLIRLALSLMRRHPSAMVGAQYSAGRQAVAAARGPSGWVPPCLTLRPRGQGPACDDGPLPVGSAAVQLAFRVPPPAVDACHAELVAKGVTIVRGPTDLPKSRHRTLFFRDPEDNVIEIYAEF